MSQSHCSHSTLRGRHEVVVTSQSYHSHNCEQRFMRVNLTYLFHTAHDAHVGSDGADVRVC